jgi:hypothetical protein
MTDVTTLRDLFVDGFNSRDVDELVDILADDVEVPDVPDDGPSAVRELVEDLWERTPAVLLTRGDLAGRPVAVVWLPEAEGGWTRAALVTFEADDRLTLIGFADEDRHLHRVVTDEPDDDDLSETDDWATWEDGVSG